MDRESSLRFIDALSVLRGSVEWIGLGEEIGGVKLTVKLSKRLESNRRHYVESRGFSVDETETVYSFYRSVEEYDDEV